jgi:hypothetical protein
MNNFYIDGSTEATLWVALVVGGSLLLMVLGKLLFRIYFAEKKKYLTDLTNISGGYEDDAKTDETE